MAALHADAAPVGVIGVGNMGLAMALRLLDRGHRVVVRDIRPDAVVRAVAAGAGQAPDGATLAARSGLLIVLPTRRETSSACTGRPVGEYAFPVTSTSVAALGPVRSASLIAPLCTAPTPS